MRAFLFAALCLALCVPCPAQTADNDPATKDDVILFFRTMHSHDMVKKMIEVESQAMQQMMHQQTAKQKDGSPDAEARAKKAIDDFLRNMPIDEMTEAMIPAYQKHFTHGEIQAMNAFYASPVGQKVLEELPLVTQEGMQAMMPLLSKYLDQSKQRMQKDLEGPGKSSTQTPTTKD